MLVKILGLLILGLQMLMTNIAKVPLGPYTVVLRKSHSTGSNLGLPTCKQALLAIELFT